GFTRSPFSSTGLCSPLSRKALPFTSAVGKLDNWLKALVTGAAPRNAMASSGPPPLIAGASPALVASKRVFSGKPFAAQIMLPGVQALLLLPPLDTSTYWYNASSCHGSSGVNDSERSVADNCPATVPCTTPS